MRDRMKATRNHFQRKWDIWHTLSAIALAALLMLKAEGAGRAWIWMTTILGIVMLIRY